MILSDIRDYIKQRHQATLADIINHFDIDEATARAMLDVWIKKHKIHCRNVTGACNSSCKQCNPQATEFYIWGKDSANGTYLSERCQVKI